MTHAMHLMGRLRGWTTPGRAPHGPDGPTGPQATPEGDPASHRPPETPSAPPLDVGPTDRPPPGMNAPWVADEAGHLARLAQLTTKHNSSWMAASAMTWRTT